ncbi:Flp pilus assembly protein CpaB [Arthrobacter sp. JZ12]|uniref:Flp pilus assembly protein CpaB n=1 Tax=Arthrobacter sp. JZ12 TaxID=2654190 RepID=UPI002B4A656F|nr:Flp pilus assembly protein CpaB [Arthrobacter sp. JZ12]WRH25527.1 Flp pilus assembly protein CpaB [Arthrobacter sp. JZ12]
MSTSAKFVGGFGFRLRGFLFRKRRLLAAAFLCAAAGVAVEALLPKDPETVQVVAAGADLPVGTVLGADNLTLVSLPRAAVPQHSFESVELLAGQQLATPVYAGDVLARNFLVGSGLLAGSPPGTVAVPLRPADASTVQLLSPGQRVDVVLSTGNGFEVSAQNTVLARGLPVLWTSEESGSGPFQAPGGQEEGLVVVAAGPDEAASLAGASSTGHVHLVLTSAEG